MQLRKKIGNLPSCLQEKWIYTPAAGFVNSTCRTYEWINVLEIEIGLVLRAVGLVGMYMWVSDQARI